MLEPESRIGRVEMTAAPGADGRGDATLPRTPRARLRLSDGRIDIAAAVLLLAIVLLGYGAYRWFGPTGPALAEGEPLLLAGFLNTTGDTVFDGALEAALDMQLRQSPYLNLLPAARVRAALQSLERPSGAPVTMSLAAGLCERLEAKAILLGSIAPLGSGYVVAIDAQGCEAGNSPVREQAPAAAKTEVLAAVGTAAARLRARLGESPDSIARFNVPAPSATTPSLEALKAYSTGLETRAKTGDAQAIAPLEQALELDPDFALAAARLGAISAALKDRQEAQRYVKQAFSRSESLTEPERLSIQASYHDIVTGRLDEVIGAYQRWTQTYPHDWVPHDQLSASYSRANRLEEALTEARAALTLGPGQIEPYQQLARALIAMDRTAEAKAALREAEDKGFDSSFGRALLYRLAFQEGDAAAMERHLQAVGGRTEGYLVVAEAARAAAAQGAFGRSRTLFAEASDQASAASMLDDAGSLMAEQGVYAALAGDRLTGRRDMFAAVDISNGAETLWMASLAASFSGMTSEAIQLAVGYAQGMPPAPDVVAARRPILEAGVALSQDDPKGALDALNRADPFARQSDPWVPYLRGLASLARKDWTQAATQFRAAAADIGHQPISLIHPLAHLQLARTLRAAGDLAGAREEYARVAGAWKHGDAGHPLVAAVAKESGVLTALPVSPQAP